MEKQEVGSFYATTFEENVYEFIVYDDSTMACPALDAEAIRKIIIKPRFVLVCEKQVYISPAESGVRDGLIRDYDIDSDIFDYLKERNMIMYSTDMAYLYGFENKKGYDRNRQKGRPYKWAEKKGPVLVKQRKGQYN